MLFVSMNYHAFVVYLCNENAAVTSTPFTVYRGRTVIYDHQLLKTFNFNMKYIRTYKIRVLLAK